MVVIATMSIARARCVLFFVFNDLILIVENSVTTQRCIIIILHCITEFSTNIIIYIYMF